MSVCVDVYGGGRAGLLPSRPVVLVVADVSHDPCNLLLVVVKSSRVGLCVTWYREQAASAIQDWSQEPCGGLGPGCLEAVRMVVG